MLRAWHTVAVAGRPALAGRVPAARALGFAAAVGRRHAPGGLVQARQQQRAPLGGGAAGGRWMSTEGTVKFSFVEPSGEVIGVEAKLGESLLDIAREKDIELEGACEGTLACSTCHCIFDQALYDTLPPPEEEELDMLDLAAALCDTSRLGCQVKVTKAFEGARIVIPDEFNDMQGNPIDESK